MSAAPKPAGAPLSSFIALYFKCIRRNLHSTRPEYSLTLEFLQLSCSHFCLPPFHLWVSQDPFLFIRTAAGKYTPETQPSKLGQIVPPSTCQPVAKFSSIDPVLLTGVARRSKEWQAKGFKSRASKLDLPRGRGKARASLPLTRKGQQTTHHKHLPLHSPANLCHPEIPILLGISMDFIHFWAFHGGTDQEHGSLLISHFPDYQFLQGNCWWF